MTTSQPTEADKALIERMYGPIAKNGVPTGREAIGALMAAARLEGHHAGRREALEPLTLDDPKDRALMNALEAMTTLCEWFSQREAGKPTTNSEAVMFARCDQASSMLEALYGLDMPGPASPSKQEGEGHMASRDHERSANGALDGANQPALTDEDRALLQRVAGELWNDPSATSQARYLAEILRAARDEGARRSPSNRPFEQMVENEDGWSDWIHPLPGYRMQCCDCGLVHGLQFEIAERNTAALALNPGESEGAVVIMRARRFPAENGPLGSVRVPAEDGQQKMNPAPPPSDQARREEVARIGLDLEALEKVARDAAEIYVDDHYVGDLLDIFSDTFDPPAVLKLIALAKEPRNG